MQRPRTGTVRTAALATVVGLCLAVPLAAASADSAGSSKDDRAAAADPRPPADDDAAAAPGFGDFGTGVGEADRKGPGDLLGLLGGGTGKAAKPSSAPPATAARVTPDEAEAKSLCGKAVEGPKGVRGQTCVERDGDEVWGSVHYRNPTAEPLLLVMSVLQPGGKALKVTCEIPGGAGDGRCESPRVRAPKGLTGWSAISEMATGDGATKLIRSGTATPER